MFNQLLAIDASIIMYIVIGVVLVLMIVLTIIPQKKRQKEQQNMMNSLTVGTKIMTIGRMVGVITQVNADNTLIINVGTENAPTLIVIDKNAVGLVLQNVAAPAEAVEEKKEENSADSVDDVAIDPVNIDDYKFSDPVADSFDGVFSEEQKEEKPSKKNKK